MPYIMTHIDEPLTDKLTNFGPMKSIEEKLLGAGPLTVNPFNVNLQSLQYMSLK